MGRAHFTAHRYEIAADWLRRAIERNPTIPEHHLVLAATLGHLGATEEARSTLQECERLQPGYASDMKTPHKYKNDVDNEHFLDGLRKAGWEG